MLNIIDDYYIREIKKTSIKLWFFKVKVRFFMLTIPSKIIINLMLPSKIQNQDI